MSLHFSMGIWSLSFRSVAEGTKCSHKASEQECRLRSVPEGRGLLLNSFLPCAKHTMCQTLYACRPISLSEELSPQFVGKEPGSVKVCRTVPHTGSLDRSRLGPRTSL